VSNTLSWIVPRRPPRYTLMHLLMKECGGYIEQQWFRAKVFC
jgi:hypothetical protein